MFFFQLKPSDVYGGSFVYHLKDEEKYYCSIGYVLIYIFTLTKSLKYIQRLFNSSTDRFGL